MSDLESGSRDAMPVRPSLSGARPDVCRLYRRQTRHARIAPRKRRDDTHLPERHASDAGAKHPHWTLILRFDNEVVGSGPSSERSSKMTKRILVAVSARTAPCVLASALAASRECDAPITLLHVIDTASCFVGAADFDCGLVMEAMQEQGRQILSLAEQWFASRGCTVTTHMLQLPTYGLTVGHAIAVFASGIDADPVLLGSRKHDGWQWLRDDIAADIVRNTGVAVRRVPDDAPTDVPHRSAPQRAATPAAGRA
ncbi:universal stress protein [Burkholderia dolosa]|uniref:universal stress protein n=1 Tax=Burkholderia dolosa TaxID=152500 RepID=UPI001B9D5445|nr:universal stress protein [Burkholderia dolosa]MBR8059835.1 universal stress protein [Burkholderia dolosa]MBY4831498.1 universal stress protein [Burkholderia dolosa]